MISIFDIYEPLDEMVEELENDVSLCQDNLDIAKKEIKSVLKNKALTEEQRKSLKLVMACIKNVRDELEELITEYEDDDNDDREFEIEVDT